MLKPSGEVSHLTSLAAAAFVEVASFLSVSSQLSDMRRRRRRQVGTSPLLA